MKIELLGQRVKIRNFKFSDADDLYENINDKEVVKWGDEAYYKYPYKKADIIRLIIKNILYRLLKKEKREYSLGIGLKENDRIIGEIKLYVIDRVHNTAEIGYWIGRKHWNKGFTTESINLALKFAFEELKLNRVYAKVYEPNIGSKKVLEKCGFKLEGVMREAKFREGKRYDDLFYGILKSEYVKNR